MLFHPKGKVNNISKSLQCVSPINGSPKLSNSVILHYHIISAEAIKQIQEKYHCSCEIHQSDG